MEPTLTLPPPVVTSNEDGSKTEVFFRINDAGKKVKVTRRFTTKSEPVSSPESRREWARYGQALSEEVTPLKREKIDLRLFPKLPTPSKEEGSKEKKMGTRVTCRFCGGDHLSFRCPLKDKLATAADLGAEMGGRQGSPQGMPPVNGQPPPPTPGMYAAPGSRGAPPLNGQMPAGMGPPGVGLGGVPGKYVPPGARMGAGGVPGMPMQRDESTTLRVTNLPDTVSEQDLRRNFSSMGRVLRCHVAKNKLTGLSRGFAFVEFASRNEAEAARKRFDGVPVDYMIMHVDFSEPREP